MDKCPLTLVDCPFQYADCETQLPRKDIPEHMKETVTHLTLLAMVTQRSSVENERLTKKNHQLQQSIQMLKKMREQNVRSFKEEGQKGIGRSQFISTMSKTANQRTI